MMLKYTLCFILHDHEVLMIYRHKAPQQNRWNGLGGKIESEELPLDGVLREVQEEANIVLRDLYFAGTVTWDQGDETGESNGMYVYIATLPDYYTRQQISGNEPTAEGVLGWLSMRDLIDPEVWPMISDNMPHFFPEIMADERPYEYRFHYNDDVIAQVSKHPLPVAEIIMCRMSRLAEIWARCE